MSNLSRRIFLGGAGAVVALPYLPSLLPAAQAATRNGSRLIAFYVPNGIQMAGWTPNSRRLWQWWWLTRCQEHAAR